MGHERDLFTSLLRAPDRDPFPCARPVLSWREDDEPAYLDDIERNGVGHYELERRGVWHGRWSELDAGRFGTKNTGGRKFRALLQRRWHFGQPIAVPRALDVRDRELRSRVDERMRLHRRWSGGEPLREWLTGALAGSPFAAGGDEPLADPERDLGRIAVTCAADPEARLWVKLGRLSTAEGDASLRMRVSFGEEGRDDASHDEARHGLVRELAEHLFSEAATAAAAEAIGPQLERLCARPVTTTQHIAYWNAPGGGALFHHDSFDEEAAQRQLGVCYVQLAGRTAWLALSIEDLAERVREFVEGLDEGELPWVREALEAAGAWGDARALAGERSARLAELALPGCGRLAPLVNRGPEFTSFLADAGHAAVLRPGDAILLPNHGLASTAMHSVFCASPRATYGLSMAVRAC